MVNLGKPYNTTAPKWVPRSPWGPFSVFGSPLGPHRVPVGPHFLFLSFRTREKSVQPPSNVAYLITCKNTNYFYESHASLSVKVDFRKKTHYFNELPHFGQFFKYTLFGSPFLLSRVPIGSPFHSKLGPHWVPMKFFWGPHAIWEQWHCFGPYRTIQQEKMATNLFPGATFFLAPCSSPGCCRIFGQV